MEIAARALRMPIEDRDHFVSQSCGMDWSLRVEVEALLLACDAAGDFLETPPSISATEAETALLGGFAPGTTIGRYEIVRRIGAGGMAEVYLAVQLTPVERRVALKVVKLGMDSHDVVRRFRLEQQALAHLQHPHIASFFDAGVNEDGRPYLVMEFLDGTSILEYCKSRRTDLAGRLHLFLNVCDAVQFAHGQLVIHRDIKPSNILVVHRGEHAVAKVVDFGLARILTTPDTSSATLTQTGLGVMTPEYASPEQIRGEPLDVRTDVFSLGVVLHQLLTDRLPFVPRDHIARCLSHTSDVQPPRPPSTWEAAVDGEARGLPSARMLKGDLDTIIMKCLQPDAERRYPSVASLREDIKRYVNGEPITARPDSWNYRTGKLIKRHRALTLALVAFMLAVVLFAGVSWTLLQRSEAALQASNESRRELLRTEALRVISEPEIDSTTRTLEAVAEAARIRSGRDLLNPAIQALSRMSIQQLTSWVAHNDFRRGAHLSWSPDGSLLATITRDWRLVMMDSATGRRLWSRPVPFNSALPHFSADGRYVIAQGENEGINVRVVRLVSSGDAVLRIDQLGALRHRSFAFDPIEPDVLWAPAGDGTIRRFDVGKGSSSVLAPGPTGALMLVRHPTEPLLLAASLSGGWRVLSTTDGRIVADHSDGTAFEDVVWNPERRDELLGSVGSKIHRVSLLGVRRGSLTGHQARGMWLDAHHQHPLLISSSWDDTTRLWDLVENREIARFDGRARGFIGDSDRFGMMRAISGERRVSLCEIKASPVLRRFSALGVAEEQVNGESASFLGETGLLATSGGNGVALWEVATGRELRRFALGSIPKVLWDPHRNRLLMLGHSGIFGSRIEADDQGLTRIEDPSLLANGQFWHGALTPSGDRLIATNVAAELLVFDADTFKSESVPTIHLGRFIAMDPGGTAFAVSAWHTEELGLHSLSDYRLTCRWKNPRARGPKAAFDPFSSRLVVSVLSQGFVFDPVTCELVRQLAPQDSRDTNLFPVFAPENSIFAMGGGLALELWDVANATHLTSLPIPFETRIHSGVAFSPNGRWLACTTRDDRIVYAWDLAELAERLEELGLDAGLITP